MRLYLTYLLLITGLSLTAQTPYFERYYDSGTNDVVRGITLLPDRVVMAGYTEPTNRSSRRSAMIVTDREGRLISSTTFPDARRSYLLDVARAGPDEVILAGWQNDSITLDNWAFYRMGTDGSQRQSFGWGQFLKDEEVFGILTRADGDIVAVGAESTSNAALIARFTTSGEELWRRTFIVPDSRFTSLQRVIEVPGGVIAAGWSTEDSDVYSTLLVRFDDDGNLLWRRKFDWSGQTSGNFRHVIRLPSGRLILAAPIRVSSTDTDIVLLELDGEGNLVRSGTMGGEGHQTVGTLHVSPAGQEGFFMVGRYRPNGGGPSSAMFIGVENILDPGLSAGLFAPNEDSFFFDAAVDEAGNYYLAGSLRECPDGDRDAFLVKTQIDLRTPATICYDHSLQLDGEPLMTVVQSEAGEAQISLSPIVEIAEAGELLYTVSQRSCPAYDLDADDSSGAERNQLSFQQLGVCYDAPLPITDDDVQPFRSGTYTDSIVLSFSPLTPPTEYLELNGVRSDSLQTLTLRNNGTLTDTNFADLLRQVRFHVDSDTISYGIRYIGVYSYTGCQLEGIAFSTIELLPKFISPLTISDTVICPGSTFSVDVTTQGITNYLWGDGAQDAIREIEEPGTYTLSRENTCGSRLDTFTVGVAPTAQPPLLPTFFLCTGDSALIDLRGSGLSYSWADGDTSAVRVFRQPIELDVTGTDGCTTSTQTIRVAALDCCPIYLPTAISPNQDGVNDHFRAYPALDCRAEISAVTFRIYDRWGGLVFSGDTLTDGWDGTSKGEAVATGTYVYDLRYFDGFVWRESRGAFVVVR